MQLWGIFTRMSQTGEKSRMQGSNKISQQVDAILTAAHQYEIQLSAREHGSTEQAARGRGDKKSPFNL